MAKRNLQTVAGNNPYAERGNEGWLKSCIDIGFAKEAYVEGDEQFDGRKHEVYLPRPRTEEFGSFDEMDEFCKEQWGPMGGLQAIIDAGIMQLFTRPNYKAHVADKGDEEEMHQAAIDLAASYQVGRKAGPGKAAETKAKAKQLDQYEKEAAELGLSMKDLIEMAKNQE